MCKMKNVITRFKSSFNTKSTIWDFFLTYSMIFLIYTLTQQYQKIIIYVFLKNLFNRFKEYSSKKQWKSNGP